MKTQTTLTNSRREKFVRYGIIAIALMAFFAFATISGMLPAFADNVDINTGALDSVMHVVLQIITKAALYIGIVIVLWGVFQIVLAFRREDSEGISKQITTVVVGAVLVGFGAFANPLYNTLINSSGGSGDSGD